MKDNTGRHLSVITEHVYIYSTSNTDIKQRNKLRASKLSLGERLCSVKFHITLINLNFYFVPLNAPQASCQWAQQIFTMMAFLSRHSLLHDRQLLLRLGGWLPVCVCVYGCTCICRCLCVHANKFADISINFSWRLSYLFSRLWVLMK